MMITRQLIQKECGLCGASKLVLEPYSPHTRSLCRCNPYLSDNNYTTISELHKHGLCLNQFPDEFDKYDPIPIVTFLEIADCFDTVLKIASVANLSKYSEGHLLLLACRYLRDISSGKIYEATRDVCRNGAYGNTADAWDKLKAAYKAPILRPTSINREWKGDSISRRVKYAMIDCSNHALSCWGYAMDGLFNRHLHRVASHSAVVAANMEVLSGLRNAVTGGDSSLKSYNAQLEALSAKREELFCKERKGQIETFYKTYTTYSILVPSEPYKYTGNDVWYEPEYPL
jgi:hypothetical protein